MKIQLLQWSKTLWTKVNGNKTTIGLVYFATIDKYLPTTLWTDVLRALFGLWTGVGILHKGYKYGDKTNIRSIRNLRQSIDSVRDRRRQVGSLPQRPEG